MSNFGDYCKLEYNREHPLDRVITADSISAYNRVFFFILRLKRVLYTLHALWKNLNMPEFRRAAQYARKLRELHFLRHQMHHFLQTLD